MGHCHPISSRKPKLCSKFWDLYPEHYSADYALKMISYEKSFCMNCLRLVESVDFHIKIVSIRVRMQKLELSECSHANYQNITQKTRHVSDAMRELFGPQDGLESKNLQHRKVSPRRIGRFLYINRPNLKSYATCRDETRSGCVFIWEIRVKSFRVEYCHPSEILPRGILPSE